jgi:outer membrane biosynthesis protein TonB
VRQDALSPAARAALTFLLLLLVIGISGCRKRTVHAAPPAPVPEAEPAPVNPQPTAPNAPASESKPETPESAPSPPALVVPPPRTTPPKPEPPKPAPPQISPRLSPEEQAAAEQKTYEDIGTAERNLQAAYGKQLNAAQHDLVEKIRGFLGQAREAIRASDWVRARNLAQKAVVLSVELINSLQ